MIKKRSVRISGHETSVTLEEEFWDILRDIAQKEGLSLNKIIGHIDENKSIDQNLSSAVRVYILRTLLAQLAQ